MSAALTPDAFLSERMGRPAFTLHAPEPGAIAGMALPAAPAFVTAKVPAADTPRLCALQARGFRVVDTALTFEAPGRAEAPPPGIRAARPQDREAVTDIARKAFRFTRFHLDPEIDDHVAARIKADWAGNYFAGRRGDGMLLAEGPAGEVAGFLLFLRDAEARLTIDLIAVAPDMAGRGLGRALVAAAFADRTGGAPPSGLLVGTQAANTPSCRLYEACGFRLARAAYVLHHHGLPA
jgi:ribosomal protein S18 acetylase RimI-like enzyme